jgi:hypothetical protein
MSLSAVVYRSRSSIDADLEAQGARKDERTGEYYFESPEIERRFPRGFSEAKEWWIGNITSVAELRDELETLTGRRDLLLIQKCLFSGSHCGDLIEPEFFSSIESEVQEILSHFRTRLSLSAKQFLDGMLNIIAVARTEKNPIVFV